MAEAEQGPHRRVPRRRSRTQEAWPVGVRGADHELLAAKQAELAALPGEAPLVPMQVDGHVVAEIIAAWTGIPLGKVVKDEIERCAICRRPCRSG